MRVARLDTAYGMIFIPEADNAQGMWLRDAGLASEDHFIREVRDLLLERPAGIVIDVGASYGTWTLALAALPTTKRLIAYEAHPEVFDLLVRTAEANHLGENVSLRNRAVWRDCRWMKMPDVNFDRPSNFGGLSLIAPLADQKEAGVIDTRTVALDDEIKDRVSFIKIDVEGAEHEVLRGAQKIIKQYRPMMFIEVYHSLSDTKGLVNQIVEMGYGVLSKGPNVLAMPI